MATPELGGGIGHLLAVLAAHHHAEVQQFLERIVDQVRVFHVHDEADVGQALVARPVRDVVQHQHVQRREVFQSGRTHAVRDPAVKGVARDDQAELELAQFGALGRDQVRRRHDGRGCGRTGGGRVGGGDGLLRHDRTPG
jgi:hypothetical protein